MIHAEPIVTLWVDDKPLIVRRRGGSLAVNVETTIRALEAAGKKVGKEFIGGRLAVDWVDSAKLDAMERESKAS